MRTIILSAILCLFIAGCEKTIKEAQTSNTDSTLASR